MWDWNEIEAREERKAEQLYQHEQYVLDNLSVEEIIGMFVDVIDQMDSIQLQDAKDLISYAQKNLEIYG